MTSVGTAEREIVRETITAICANMTQHENEGADPAAAEFFTSLLANDFRIRRVRGSVVQDKATFIGALPAGASVDRAEVGELEIYPYETGAIVSLVISAASRRADQDATPSPARALVRNIRIFRRRVPSDGEVPGIDGWVLAMWHNSEIAS